MKQDSKIIYIACPYSHKEEFIEGERYRTATQIAMQLVRAGYRVFSPITHAHPIRTKDSRISKTWEFWKDLDKPFLEVSALMLVLMLDGWDKSIGVHEEIQIAHNNGIPIIYLPRGDFANAELLVERWDTLGILKPLRTGAINE